MPENIENTLSPYEKRLFNQEFGLCSDCNQPKTDYFWCKIVVLKYFNKNLINELVEIII